jgi:hypothetical protein
VTSRSVEALFSTLNAASVRYLVVGGLAVVAHGHMRLTADVDLVLDLDEGNLRRAVAAFGELGYRPRAPVDLDDFVDRSKRDEWVRDKNLVVFSLFSVAHPATEVDLFVESPFDFGPAYERAARMAIGEDVTASFVSLGDLIEMKRAAGRPQDVTDIEHLRRLQEGR